VPQTVYVLSVTNLANPKSTNFIYPIESINQFYGFKSLFKSTDKLYFFHANIKISKPFVRRKILLIYCAN